MKNLYELAPEEKSKFRKQFNELPFTKDINSIRKPALFVGLIAAFVSGILSSLIEEGNNLQSWLGISEAVTAIAFIILIISEIEITIAFTRWMKIKHKIDY